MRSDDVMNERFRATKFDVGYDQAEVDRFLDRVHESLLKLEEGSPIDEAPVSAQAVEEVRFTQTRFREGYDPRDVDAFLDRLQSAFQEHERRSTEGR